MMGKSSDFAPVSATSRAIRLAQTRYVKPVPYSSATRLTADVYRQMQADFLPIPLLTLHSPAPEVLAGVWSMLREALLAGR